MHVGVIRLEHKIAGRAFEVRVIVRRILDLVKHMHVRLVLLIGQISMESFREKLKLHSLWEEGWVYEEAY